MADFKDVLREHRYAKDWTQGELASQIGTNQTQVSQWETGREDFGTWALGAYFDKLLTIFDYPEDMLTWWVEQQLTAIEKTTSKAHEYKEHASGRSRPVGVLARLDHLIEQNRRQHADLTELRTQLKEMT